MTPPSGARCYTLHMNIEPAVRAEALAFLQAHSAAVIATVSKDYLPHASVVYYCADDSFNVYFLTKIGSRKYNAIKAHPQGAFVIGRQDVPQTLQIEGVISELESEEDKARCTPQLMNVLEKQTPGIVPAGKMDGELAIMWLQPKWIRWADFSVSAIGDKNLFVEIPVA
jgi:general stress protein 26